MALAHEVLGVRPGADAREVRVAFRRCTRAHHPDRGGDPERFRAGLRAYQRLAGLSAPSHGAPGVVFHRRPRGLAVVTAAWRRRRRRRRRQGPPRVV